MIKSFVACALLVFASVGPTLTNADQKISELLNQDRDYATLPGELFDTLGWNLPDGGRAVRALADRAPGGAFDPKKLVTLPANSLGYHATWHIVRYKFYGLDWDITGL